MTIPTINTRARGSEINFHFEKEVLYHLRKIKSVISSPRYTDRVRVKKTAGKKSSSDCLIKDFGKSGLFLKKMKTADKTDQNPDSIESRIQKWPSGAFQCAVRNCKVIDISGKNKLPQVEIFKRSDQAKVDTEKKQGMKNQLNLIFIANIIFGININDEREINSR